MSRFFKKAHSEAQQGTSKPNMIKKFGSKLKKAISKNKQSLAKKSNEPNVQNTQPEGTALLNSSAKQIKQPCTGSVPDIVSTHASVDEELQVAETTSPELVATLSRQPAVPSLESVSQDDQRETSSQQTVESAPSTPQQSKKPSDHSDLSLSGSTHGSNTDRKRISRSNSFPTSPSSPTTGASSVTLYNNSGHSNASSPLSLVEYRQLLDKHGGSCSNGHRALAEHIRDEEKNIENSEWAAIVEWTKASHQAEVVNLKKDHATIVEELRKERSEARRRLELRNRELRAIKREMKDLKKSVEEATKAQEEKQPASNPHPADESDAESVDQDEGGVLLAQDSATPTEKVDDKREKTSYVPQQVEEAEHRMRIANQGMKEAKVSRKETAEEKKKRQQALKQQLMEDSTPEASSVAEAGLSAATQKATAIRRHNKAPFMEIRDLQDHNNALQAEAEAMEEEVKVLKAQNHFAQLEVGHCHAANACYRAAAEDDNPARTAHLDGLLKRKDEAYTELEERAAECAKMLAEEKKQRAIEKEYSAAEIRGMHKELAHRFKVIEALTESRDIFKAQNDWVFQMFQGKISQNNVIEAFMRDYLVIQKDNSLLIKMIKERQCYMVNTEKQLADLKAEKIANDHAAHADYLEHRQTQQSLNGLIYVNSQVNAKIELQDDMRSELKEELEGQLKQQAAEFQALLLSGADDWLIQRQQAQEQQIDFLNAKITEANGIANQWRIRSLEQDDGFCPLNDFSEVADFNAEETRWRLKEAERQVVHLQQVVREMNRERKGKGKEREQQVVEEMSRDRKGKGKEREVLETNREKNGKGKEKEVLEIGHDGSKWLQDRAEAEKVREQFRWMK